MKKYFLIFSLLFSELSISQVVTIINQNNLQAIPGVQIRGNGNNESTVTDSRGSADLSAFVKSDSVQVSHLAYQDLKISLAALRQKGALELSERSYNIDELVVSASRFAEKKKDVAQPIEVITARDITYANQQTSADLLQNTGNVFVQHSQLGGGSPVIRGFETNKVLLVVDGIRMNNAIYRGGHLQNVITLDNNSIEKIEVVFGPGSVVYGSDALGGVMHFSTKNPQLSGSKKTLLKSDGFLRYGSVNQERTAHVELNYGKKTLASLTALTFSKFDDLLQGRNRNPFYGDFGKRDFYVKQINGYDSAVVNSNPDLQVMSGYEQVDLLQKFLYSPNESVSHLINLQYSMSGNIPRYDRLVQTSGGQPRYGDWHYGPQKRLLAAYHLNLKNSTRMFDLMQFIMAYQNIEESRFDRAYRSDELNVRSERLDIVTLNLDMEKKFGKNELRYGFEGTYNYVNSSAYRQNIRTDAEQPLDSRYPDGGSTMQSAAAFITHTLEISPKLILNDGIRLSNVQLHSEFIDTSFYHFPFTVVDQNNTAVNGNLGLVYMPGQNWRITILGSSGFRAPNVDDLSKVFESTPGNVVVPNPDLGPEYTYNIDLGISKTFDENIVIGGNGYYTHYFDAISTNAGRYNGSDSIRYEGQLSRVTMNNNTGRAFIYGLNGYFNAQITHHFTLYSNINYTYGRIKTDSTDYPLDHIPPVFGKTGLVLKLRKFRSELFALYNGWKRLNDYNLLGEDNENQATREGMPAWFTLNVRLAYQLNKNIQAQFAIENILDQNYRIFASGISAPGRNILLALRANF